MRICLALLIAGAVLSAAGTTLAQQTAATPGVADERLRTECLRLFDGKKYAGKIEKSDHPRYRARRDVVLTTAVEHDSRAEHGQPQCTVKVRSEDDGHQVIVRDYVFDGSVAKWTSPYSNPDRVWLTLTPRGPCLRYGGSLALYGTLYSAGEGLFCQ